jgi:hypothetical protein
VGAERHGDEIRDIDDGCVAEVRVTIHDSGNPLKNKCLKGVWKEEGEIRGGEWGILKSQPKIAMVNQPKEDIFDIGKYGPVLRELDRLLEAEKGNFSQWMLGPYMFGKSSSICHLMASQ